MSGISLQGPQCRLSTGLRLNYPVVCHGRGQSQLTGLFWGLLECYRLDRPLFSPREYKPKLDYKDEITGSQCARHCLSMGGMFPNIYRREASTYWHPSQRKAPVPYDLPKSFHLPLQGNYTYPNRWNFRNRGYAIYKYYSCFALYAT